MTVLTKRETWARLRPARSSPRRLDELSTEEQASVQAALAFLRRRYGSWPKLAAALSFPAQSLWRSVKGRRQLTAGLALRVARLAGVPTDEVLSGAWPKTGMCPHCGHV